jgi:hypothetical protein
MRPETRHRAIRGITTALLILAAALAAFGQETAAAGSGTAAAVGSGVVPAGASSRTVPALAPAIPSAAIPVSGTAAVPAADNSAVEPLLAFRDAEVKFRLADLMDVLRDRRHEGWVLAAYPDPKTGRPLIGAGFSLDLPEREHPQTDPSNPHVFVEPSSAELWQAAGLDPARLQQILATFDENAAEWKWMRRHRRRVPELAAEITDDDAESLLRIAAIQAIENARAYCRNFDALTGPQQMALSQLVYQMGVNLGEFDQFLSLINNNPVANAGSGPSGAGAALVPAGDFATNVRYWTDVEDTLIHSQWARLYRVRAVSVIAMLDPRYADDPGASEMRVASVLRPVRHSRRGRPALRMAAYHRRTGRSGLTPGRSLSRRARVRARRRA